MTNHSHSNMQETMQKLKVRRRLTGLTAAQVSEMLGVSITTVINWENGKHYPNCEKYLAYLQIIEEHEF